MSNNVTYLRTAVRAELPKTDLDVEPTALQQAVLVRARELRERESQPRKRSTVQWATSAVLAVICFGIMYGMVDGVLRKVQRLAEDFAEQPQQGSAPAGPAPEREAPQSKAPDQPYFIELQTPDADAK